MRVIHRLSNKEYVLGWKGGESILELKNRLVGMIVGIYSCNLILLLNGKIQSDTQYVRDRDYGMCIRPLECGIHKE